MDVNANQRVCAGCYQIGQSLLMCTRCKVYCYCNKTCQTTHWKLVHKKTCKAQNIIPPKEDESITEFQFDFNKNSNINTISTDLNESIESIDIRYNHIILYPCQSISELQDKYETLVVGCNDQELEKYISENSKDSSNSNSNNINNNDSNTGSDSTSITNNTDSNVNDIQHKYNWLNGMSSSTLPGYSMDYNGTTKIIAYHDSNTNTATTLGYSLLGTYSIMSGHCHGNVILTLRNSHEECVSLSRREVLTMILHNYRCSEMNTVSQRVHFENIRRNEAKIVLHKQGYNII